MTHHPAKFTFFIDKTMTILCECGEKFHPQAAMHLTHFVQVVCPRCGKTVLTGVAKERIPLGE
jgi:hypothetical protein